MEIRKPLKILIVEDDEQDALLLKMAMDEIDVDARIRFVGGGKEAMEYLQSASVSKTQSRRPLPNLLVLDLKMPCVSGFEVLQWLRSHPRLKPIFVAVLSGSEWKADHEKAYAMGADFCAIKPLHFRELIKVVKSLVAAYFFPLSTLRASNPRTYPGTNGALHRAQNSRGKANKVETEQT